MRNLFLTMMIAMMLWNANGENHEAAPKDYSRFTLGKNEFTVEEAGLPSGSQVKPIRGWYINGLHIVPKEIKHKGAIVVFGGSGGDCDYMSAFELAREGYEIYGIDFYGKDRQPKKMDRIPLDFFAELYLYIQRTAESPKPLTVHGYSRGTELTLLLASHFPDQVDNVVLYAPLAYAFQHDFGVHHSPWTFRGKELPYVSFEGEETKAKTYLAMRNKKPSTGPEFFLHALEVVDNKEEARIRLESIRAKMLIFAGGVDGLLPAAEMGREIKANYKGECALVIFEKAGHWFSEQTTFKGYLDTGGEPEDNLKAKEISDRIRLEKLAEWTK